MAPLISYRFPKAVRLLRRNQFRRIAYGCERREGKLLVVELKKNNLPCARLGITVTKKYGKSHDRNRFKRLVREAFRLSRHALITGVDIVVRPRFADSRVKTSDFIEELLKLIGGSCDCSGSASRAEGAQPQSEKSC